MRLLVQVQQVAKLSLSGLKEFSETFRNVSTTINLRRTFSKVPFLGKLHSCMSAFDTIMRIKDAVMTEGDFGHKIGAFVVNRSWHHSSRVCHTEFPHDLVHVEFTSVK